MAGVNKANKASILIKLAQPVLVSMVVIMHW